MEEKYRIQITNQNITDKEPDNIEVICIGTCAKDGCIYTIQYDDIVEDSNQMIQNKIVIDAAATTVSITKEGAIGAYMQFRQGEKTHTVYDTPYGTIHMVLHTRSIETEILETELSAYLEYAIEVNYETVSECKVSIHAAKL